MDKDTETVWMAVTKDKYELPVAVADTRKELAQLVGVHPDAIRIALYRAGKSGGRCRYVKVQIERL